MERDQPGVAGSGDSRGQDSAPGEATERMKQAGRETVDSVRNEARGAAQETATKGQTAAASVAGDSAEALDRAAQAYAEQGNESLARSASALSSKLAALADRLEHQSLDDLTREAKRIARNNPAQFIAGGLVLGLALSRFFKASSSRSGDHHASAGTHETDARTLPQGQVGSGTQLPGNPGTDLTGGRYG